MTSAHTLNQPEGKPSPTPRPRRWHDMPFGAKVLPCNQGNQAANSTLGEAGTLDAGVLFRLWAPTAKGVSLILLQPNTPEQPEKLLPMLPEPAGWFSLRTELAHAGSWYQFQLEDSLRVPDPASRFQPQDVHGPSQVIDPTEYRWKDGAWQGRPWAEAVIYELHVGAFTPEGTFKAAESKLDHLVELGITAIELMPLADFPGERNWGYDGVLLYAPDSRYGSVNDLKALIDAAHRKGLMIFLDVVYNHFGPEGNYLHCYAKSFFDETQHTLWGAAIQLNGPAEVREFFIHNALFWLEEYHFDGLRLDAVHALSEPGGTQLLEALSERVHGAFSSERQVHLILENDHNQACWLQTKTRAETKPETPAEMSAETRSSQTVAGGSGGYQAQWNDDFHHAAHVIATGESDGYYADYAPTTENARLPLENLRRCLTSGFAYQGETSNYRGQVRGESTAGLPCTAFVNFLQNHDQIGNRAWGERLSQIASPQAIKAFWEVLLLAPGVPMLFMGEEWQATQPFLFFCDFSPELASAVTAGRLQEFTRFPAFSHPDALAPIPDPSSRETYQASQLDWGALAQPEHQAWLVLCKRLLGIRRREIIPRLAEMTVDARKPHSALMGDRGLVVQWSLPDGQTLKLAANLGPEPLTLTGSLFDNRDFRRHDLLYQSEEAVAKLLESEQMPPWSVIWLIG